jgi:hypothetical protein
MSENSPTLNGKRTVVLQHFADRVARLYGED